MAADTETKTTEIAAAITAELKVALDHYLIYDGEKLIAQPTATADILAYVTKKTISFLERKKFTILT